MHNNYITSSGNYLELLPWAYDSDAKYYARGFGLLSLYAPLEYSEFSKAVFGDEETLGMNPELVYSYSGGADEFQFIPLAILIWRYM